MRPAAHAALERKVERILKGSNAKISEFMGDVDCMLRQRGIEVEDIEGRPKSLASIRAKQAPSPRGVPSKVRACAPLPRCSRCRRARLCAHTHTPAGTAHVPLYHGTL